MDLGILLVHIHIRLKNASLPVSMTSKNKTRYHFVKKIHDLKLRRQSIGDHGLWRTIAVHKNWLIESGAGLVLKRPVFYESDGFLRVGRGGLRTRIPIWASE